MEHINGIVKHGDNHHADSLQRLADTISKAATGFSERMTELGHDQPDMENPFPPIVTDATIQEHKFKILQTCERLMALVLGPTEWLMHQNMSFIDPACVGTALRMGLFELIEDSDEGTSLDQLSDATGASKDLIERVLRVCTQRLVFEEVSPRMYKHNAMSRTMLVPTTAALVDFCCDDGFKAGAAMIDNLQERDWQVPDTQSGSPFSRALGTSKGMFGFYSEDDRARGERFALAMAGTEMIKTLTEEIYPFEKLPLGSTVVDVGGGIGTVSLRIMEKVPHVSFVVQDQAGVIEVADVGSAIDGASKRISFMAHDFFEVQPVKGAEVYLFRFILHDHPDSVCVRILRNIVEAMDPTKSRILIDDAVVPDTLGQDSARFYNFLDIHMLTILNAKERTRSQWEQLAKAADERLCIERIWEPSNAGIQSGRVIELKIQDPPVQHL